MPGLQNTLSGNQVQSEYDAAQQQLQAILAQQAQAAAQAQSQATQAGQDYQQAAAAPMPDIGALAAFLPALLGNTAAVIGQNPQYARTAQESTADARQRLLDNRKQNLDALALRYREAADNAARLGNTKMEAEFRAKLEGVDAKNHKLLEDQRHANEMSQIHARGGEDRSTEALRSANDLAQIAAKGAEDRKTILAKPTKSPAERAAMARQGVNPDSGFLLTGFAQRELTRRLALAKKSDSKTRDEAFSSAQDLIAQRWDSDKTPRDMAARLVSYKHPFYKPTTQDARYGLTGEKIYKKVGKDWVKDEAAANRAVTAAKEIVDPWFTTP